MEGARAAAAAAVKCIAVGPTVAGSAPTSPSHKSGNWPLPAAPAVPGSPVKWRKSRRRRSRRHRTDRIILVIRLRLRSPAPGLRLPGRQARPGVQAVTSHGPSAGQAAQAAARLLNRICSPFRQTGRTVPRCVVGLSHWQSSSCRATVGISSSRLKDGLIIISVASTGLDNSRILH